MTEPAKFHMPTDDDQIKQLHAGDELLVSGTIYTARDMAHKRMIEAIERGEELPFEPAGAGIYYVGPTPARPGMPLGSAGPTTSSRMDAFTPALLERGVKVTMGKGYRGEAVRDALKEYCGVHLATIGGAAALLAKHIVSAEVIAYEDLETEAVRKLRVVDFPAVVAYDCYGNSVYKAND